MSRSSTLTWVERQERFYETRSHAHLRYAPDSLYAKHLVEWLLQTAQIAPGSQALEVGCGSGRFTLPLLQQMQGQLTAFDLSEKLLGQLRQHLKANPMSSRHGCEVVAGDIYQLERIFGADRFDVIVGFFFLHHLEDLRGAIRQMRRVLRPRGRMVFVEPNRRNPLFALQVLCCADMRWSEERGMFTLGRRKIREAFCAEGMRTPTLETFGAFPPQVLEWWPWTLSLQRRIEQWAVCRPVLPFRLISSTPVEPHPSALGSPHGLPAASTGAGGVPAEESRLPERPLPTALAVAPGVVDTR